MNKGSFPRTLIFAAIIFGIVAIPSIIGLNLLQKSEFRNGQKVATGFGAHANQIYPFDPSFAIKFRRKVPHSQNLESYNKWLGSDPSIAKKVFQYQSFLNERGVGNVIEMRQLLQGCPGVFGRPDLAFNVPPPEYWGNIVPTLKYFKENVRPQIGPVRLYHGYRNLDANKACGSHSMVHPKNSAIDLVPLEMSDPAKIERKLYEIFLKTGKESNVGMGFYGIGLIHIDTQGFRSWGPDTKFKTSPCRLK